MTGMLQGKVVVVTGGASGIGRGIAQVAARHNAKAVVIADMTEHPREGGESTTDLLRELGVRTLFFRTDVTSRDQCDALVEATMEMGGVDVMVCNAGIALPGDGPQISLEDFHKILAVNLHGVLFCAQAAATQMRRLLKTGSIIATSSMGGIRGTAVTVGYSASKGGVCLLVASLADAWGPEGIRVNAVCPGLIDTALVSSSPGVAAAFDSLRQRTPLRRLGKPSEVGEVVAWLGSDYSSYVTGVSFPVDGGLLSVI
jgi:L-rhamnose 1-dehydrogenase